MLVSWQPPRRAAPEQNFTKNERVGGSDDDDGVELWKIIKRL